MRGKVGFQVPSNVMGDLDFVYDVSLFGSGELLVKLGTNPMMVEAPKELPGEQGPKNVVIGEASEIGDIAIMVLGWDRVPSTDYYEPEEGNEFVAVDVLIWNGKDKSESFSADLQMAVKDGTGQRYEPDFEAQQATSREDIGGELSSAERVRGLVGFQVPSDVVGDLEFVFDASIWEKGKLFFELGAEPASTEAPDSFGSDRVPESFAGDLVFVFDGETLEEEEGQIFVELGTEPIKVEIPELFPSK